MANFDYLLQPLRLAIRQGNITGIRIGLKNCLRKANDINCDLALRSEIYLEIVKAYRCLGEHDEAYRYCDAALSHLQPSANSIQILSALKRLKVLLFLDSNNIPNASSLLGEIDGLEMMLQHGQTHISRNESDITVETWLLSVEVALAEKNTRVAQDCFVKSIEAIAKQEIALRKKKISPLEMRRHEQYLLDVRLLCDVYGGVLRIVHDDLTGFEIIQDLIERVTEQNEKAAFSKIAMPNQPLLAKLRCVTGEWLPDEPQAPIGINREEAIRWFSFGLLRIPDTTGELDCSIELNESRSFPHQLSSDLTTSLPDSDLAFGQNVDDSNANRTAIALEQIATAFARLENVAPYLENLVFEKNASNIVGVKSSSLFSGHLLVFDLAALLLNARQSEITGYIKFTWSPEYYESQIILGILPGNIKVGEAYLFMVGGFVTDATIGNAGESVDELEAVKNFKTIVQICFSIGLDVSPDLYGDVIQAANVANRKRFLKISPDHLLNYLTMIENDVAVNMNIQKVDDVDMFETLLVQKVVSNDVTVAEPPQVFVDANDDIFVSEFIPESIEVDDLPLILDLTEDNYLGLSALDDSEQVDLLTL